MGILVQSFMKASLSDRVFGKKGLFFPAVLGLIVAAGLSMSIISSRQIINLQDAGSEAKALEARLLAISAESLSSGSIRGVLIPEYADALDIMRDYPGATGVMSLTLGRQSYQILLGAAATADM